MIFFRKITCIVTDYGALHVEGSEPLGVYFLMKVWANVCDAKVNINDTAFNEIILFLTLFL